MVSTPCSAEAADRYALPVAESAVMIVFALFYLLLVYLLVITSLKSFDQVSLSRIR